MPQLDVFLDMVNKNAGEFGVTLLVSGRIVTGTLTPGKRGADWLKEVVLRAAHEGGHLAVPPRDWRPISETEAEAIRENDRVNREQAGAGEDQEDQITYASLCLRNATIHGSVPALNSNHPYLFVNTDSVAAFTIGFLGEPEKPPEDA